MRLKMIKMWHKSLGLCWMCQNRGITTWFMGGPPSGYCGPCYRNGYYELVEVKK